MNFNQIKIIKFIFILKDILYILGFIYLLIINLLLILSFLHHTFIVNAMDVEELTKNFLQLKIESQGNIDEVKITPRPIPNIRDSSTESDSSYLNTTPTSIELSRQYLEEFNENSDCSEYDNKYTPSLKNSESSESSFNTDGSSSSSSNTESEILWDKEKGLQQIREHLLKNPDPDSNLNIKNNSEVAPTKKPIAARTLLFRTK